jgi:AraC-like DNA-binding protein
MSPPTGHGEQALVTIAAFVRDRSARARLSAAAGRHARVCFCDDLGKLISAVADGVATAVVTEWRDANGVAIDGVVRSLHNGYPGVPILMYAELTPQGARDILAASRAGVCDVLFANVDDLRERLGPRLASARYSVLAADAMSQIADIVPRSVAPLVEYLLQRARSAPTISAAAQCLGVHRKTLALRCARAGLPSPSALSSWARLLLTAQRLDAPGRTAERAALEAGFASGSAFRNMLKRYTGLSPNEVRERGGSRWLVRQFVARLAGAPSRSCDGLGPKARSGEYNTVTSPAKPRLDQNVLTVRDRRTTSH